MARSKPKPQPKQAALTVKSDPLIYGKWPDQAALLVVDGVQGVWTFAGADACGNEYCLVHLVGEGEDPEHTAHSLARLERVRVLL